MPFKLLHIMNGYKVQNIETKKTYSKSPLPKEKAIKQLQAIQIHYKK